MSKRTNSMRPDGPVAFSTILSTADELGAASIAAFNAAQSGCPTAASILATTVSKGVAEVTLTRVTATF